MSTTRSEMRNKKLMDFNSHNVMLDTFWFIRLPLIYINHILQYDVISLDESKLCGI